MRQGARPTDDAARPSRWPEPDPESSLAASVYAPVRRAGQAGSTCSDGSKPGPRLEPFQRGSVPLNDRDRVDPPRAGELPGGAGLPGGVLAEDHATRDCAVLPV